MEFTIFINFVLLVKWAFVITTFIMAYKAIRDFEVH
jgi:hypothetical protein